MGVRHNGMRTIRGLVAALLVGLAITAFAPTPAYACSCVGGQAADFVVGADVVLTGTMEKREEPAAWKSSADPATYTVTVDRVYKGAATSTQEVLTPVSGASCGLENITLGDRYVVFGSYENLMAESSDELWATLCAGTDRATPQYVAAVEAVAGTGAAPTSGPGTATDPGPEGERAASGDLADDGPPAQPAVPLAAPMALASGGALVVLTGLLWVRFWRR